MLCDFENNFGGRSEPLGNLGAAIRVSTRENRFKNLIPGLSSTKLVDQNDMSAVLKIFGRAKLANSVLRVIDKNDKMLNFQI
jgi:hypothetical protein